MHRSPTATLSPLGRRQASILLLKSGCQLDVQDKMQHRRSRTRRLIWCRIEVGSDLAAWIETWNSSQGFWAATQAVGTIIAAVAALIALAIARKQLRGSIQSNQLLTSSNDAMTESSSALTRPYIVVGFQYRPFVDRAGVTRSTTVTVHVENAGRTPAENLRLRVEPSFPVPHARARAGRAAFSSYSSIRSPSRAIRRIACGSRYAPPEPFDRRSAVEGIQQQP